MSTQTETLKLALEALETLTEGHSLGGKKLGDKAIIAIKEALSSPNGEAQPERDASIKTLEGLWYSYHGGERWKPPLGKPPAWLAEPEQRSVSEHLEPVAVVSGYYGGQCVILPIDPARIFNSGTALYTSPPARKPLTHEQRVDLLTKFEPHKHEWHAPAILIDMVEDAHGIKENT